MNNKFTVALDIDGVIRNFENALKNRIYQTHQEVVINYFGYNIKDYWLPSKYYDWDKMIPFWDKNQSKDYTYKDKDNAKAIFLESKSYPDAIYAANKLFTELDNHGGHLAIVTDQNRYSLPFTIQWLEKYGIKFHSLHITDDKLMVKWDTIIDDNPYVLKSACEAGIHPIRVERYWNINADCGTSCIDAFNILNAISIALDQFKSYRKSPYVPTRKSRSIYTMKLINR